MMDLGDSGVGFLDFEVQGLRAILLVFLDDVGISDLWLHSSSICVVEGSLFACDRYQRWNEKRTKKKGGNSLLNSGVHNSYTIIQIDQNSYMTVSIGAAERTIRKTC